MSRSWWLALMLLGALLPNCSDSDSSPGPSALPDDVVRPLVRLWRDRTPVQIIQPEVQRDAGSLWFASQFDGTQQFYRALPEAQGGLAYEEYRPQGGELRLTSEQHWGVCATGPMRGGEAISVRVRVRPGRKLPNSKELPLVAVIELTEPFDPGVTLDQDEVLALLDSRRNASRVITGMVGQDTLELRTDFVTDPGTQALVVYLLAPLDAPARPLVYESLRVRRFSLSEYVAAGGVVRRMQRLADGGHTAAVRVQLDRDEREGLVAVAPSRFTWELPGTASARRLELSLGVMPRHAGMDGSVRFLVEVDDAVLLDVTRQAPGTPAEAAWEDHVIDLPATPDSALRLSLATEAVGDDPPLAFFGHPSVSTDTGEDRPNVVLISLDTLRPDRLGCYGAEPSHSPHLDGLAAQGLRFEAAYSTSSYTLPSHGSLLTGQYPAFHGAVDVTDTLDPARSPLLADLFAQAGYVTAGFTGGGYVSSEYGFAQGFDRYSHNDPVWAIDTLRGSMLLQTMSWERLPLSPELLRRYDVRSVTDWLAMRPGSAPFFLFSQPWLQSHGLLGRPGDDAFERPFNHKDRERFNKGEQVSLSAVQAQYLPYYDATIATADAFVGRVLAALDQAGLARDTMVVVTSDHGEEFGEHAFFGHGETLYDDNTRVPLIVRLPESHAGEAGQVLGDPVSLVDIAPWVLEVADIGWDDRMSVQPPLGPDRFSPPGRSLSFMELDNHRYRTSAVRSGDLKLTVRLGQDGTDFETERLELYDLAADPGEVRDLSGERPQDVAQLRERLRAFHEYAEALFPRDGSKFNLADLSPETLSILKALGYLGDVELPRDDD